MKISNSIKEDPYIGKRTTANTYRLFKTSVAYKYVGLVILHTQTIITPRQLRAAAVTGHRNYRAPAGASRMKL